jgi:DNA-binding beta-propeller fold protein YncE
MRFFAVLLAALVLLLLPGTAMAAPGDPWVAYVANSVVVKQSAPAPVILRADPASGGLAEISRNGSQGDLFRHPYDIAVAADGSLLVADMGAFATSTDRTPDGRIIRVDPVTGQQSLVTSGNMLVDPAGLAVAPDGLIYVVENVGTMGAPSVVSVNPATGAQTLVTQDGQLCYPFGIALHPNGSLLVTNYGDFSDGSTVINCAHDFGSLVEIDPATGTQSILSRNAAQWGNLFRNPLGVTVEPGGRILLVNQNGGTALVAVDPDTGVQDAETSNTASDRVVVPQRPAVTPDGDVVLSDFTLDDLEGGLVSVDLPAGSQTILRQDRQLFNNPLGVAVISNRAPAPALSASPGLVGRQPAGQLRRVRLLGPRGSPAPLRVGPGRQRQLRDGRRHEPEGHAHLRGLDDAHPARARERSTRRLRGRAGLGPGRLDQAGHRRAGRARLHDRLQAVGGRSGHDQAPAARWPALARRADAAPERPGRQEPPEREHASPRLEEAEEEGPLPRRGARR